MPSPDARQWSRREFTSSLAAGGLGLSLTGRVEAADSAARGAVPERIQVASSASQATPGAAGKPVYRIYPLRNGDVGIRGVHAFKGGSETEVYPYRLYAFLVLGGEKPMLVDAGLLDVADMNRGAAHVLATPIVQKPGHTIPNQLRKFGLRPEEIGHLFITHLHFDHVDGFEAFTNAIVHVGRKEWEIAVKLAPEGRSWAPGRFLHRFLNEPEWKERLSLVEDQEILPGVESFLVGGHTPGSMAYSFNTVAGRTVCTGDTVSLLANIEKDVAVGVHQDADECMSGMRKIRERADFVMPSHDPANELRWPPLPSGTPRYTIRAIKVGSCDVRDSVTFHGSESRETRPFNLYVWAILGGPKPIVVETGPNPKYLAEFNRGTAAYIPGGVKQTPEEQTPAALARCGIDPADVGHVIITHAHADHYDYFPLFTNARLVINRTELEQNLHRLNPDVLNAITSRPNAVQIVGDEDIVPGVRAVPLGCHTPGSQGVLVQTWAGPALLTGDTVYLYENIEKNLPTNSPDRRACVDAMARIRSLSDIVLPAHDPETLVRWPDGIIGAHPSTPEP